MRDAPGRPAVAGRRPGASVAAFAYPESAVRAIGHAARYRAWRDSQRGRLPELAGLDPAGARDTGLRFLTGHPDGGWLAEAGRRPAAGRYQIPIVATRVVASSDEAVAAAAELGGPVVLKAEVDRPRAQDRCRRRRLDLRTAGRRAGRLRGS